MPYDPAVPTVPTSLRNSNPILRADKTFLKNGLEREHDFTGSETAGDTGEHLRHLMGSARIYVYDNATELTTVILAANYSQARARFTGRVVIDAQYGRIWYCENGATDVWSELSKVGGALAVGGNLSAGGTLGVTGNTSLGGDLTLLTTKKLVLPSGESQIRNPGATDTLDVFTHAARHRPGGADGVWTTPNDFLPFSIQRVVPSTTLLNGNAISNTALAIQAFGAAGIAKCEVSVSTVGRPTTSRGLLYGEFTTKKGVGGTVEDERIEMGLYLDNIGTRLDAVVYRFFEQNMADNLGFQTHSCLRWVTGLTAAAHKFAMHLFASGAIIADCTSVNLIYVDLGTE